MKNTVKQKIGLLFALCACVLFWLPIYSVRTTFLFFSIEKETINLVPNLASGLWALGIVFLLYVRGIISFKSKKLRLISILVNWSLFSTFLEIILSPIEKNIQLGIADTNFILLMSAVVFVSILLFGVKEIAKLVLILLILGSFFSHFMIVSESMGSFGFIALAFVIISFYLQGNLDIKVLKIEARYLFGNSKSQTIHIVESAKK